MFSAEGRWILLFHWIEILLSSLLLAWLYHQQHHVTRWGAPVEVLGQRCGVTGQLQDPACVVPGGVGAFVLVMGPSMAREISLQQLQRCLGAEVVIEMIISAYMPVAGAVPEALSHW
ncbi:hypothetical protein C8J57DRAFT_1259094 [Mycena rebaudengoi]|nr:hypothetical protein C8J57DRAFT_1259094 [Mycena rebaudengoi]